jgi:pimeloyl-ACP methyl ester carboxylesterase
MGMSHHSFLGIGARACYRQAYVEWGAPETPNTLFCVHGLTRTGRDFDFIAAALEDSYRVLCPDVLGRGASDWSDNPEDYNLLQYVSDAMMVFARSGAASMDWLGTSMGGMIGMTLASMPGSPIRRLILNDIGPLVPKAAVERIGAYAGNDPRFESVEAVEDYYRTVHAPFGKLTDAQWRHMTVHNIRRHEDGSYGLAYDPKIAAAFKVEPAVDIDMWDIWDRIDVPVLVLRGAESDLLPVEVAAEMTRRGPKAEIVEIPDCGHAPALMDPAQIAIVRDWLLR